MDPMLQQRFMEVDRNRSGTISVDEISRAYSSLRFPVSSARMLLRGITDLPHIDMQTFPMFDKYVTSFYA